MAEGESQEGRQYRLSTARTEPVPGRPAAAGRTARAVVMTPAELAEFIAEVKAAHAALDGKGPHAREWDAWFGDQGIKKRWTSRPHGRDAAPGDLDGWQLPGEWPHGGDVRCRRCDAVSSLDGHPHGCPRTPGTVEERYLLHALRRCYCGQALVPAPEMLGACLPGHAAGAAAGRLPVLRQQPMPGQRARRPAGKGLLR